MTTRIHLMMWMTWTLWTGKLKPVIRWKMLLVTIFIGSRIFILWLKVYVCVYRKLLWIWLRTLKPNVNSSFVNTVNTSAHVLFVFRPDVVMPSTTHTKLPGSGPLDLLDDDCLSYSSTEHETSFNETAPHSAKSLNYSFGISMCKQYIIYNHYSFLFSRFSIYRAGTMGISHALFSGYIIWSVFFTYVW